MKILNVEQVRAADNYTILNEPISSIDLMERAAMRCFEWIESRLDKNLVYHIVAGMGNNGGDGLVIARLMAQNGISCTTSIVEFSDQGSPDFQTNLKRLKETTTEIQYVKENESLDIHTNEVIIDALFGSGLSRQLEGWIGTLIKQINFSGCDVISIDIPSGLFMDDNSKNDGKVVHADITLTFESPKLSFLLPETGENVGEWDVLDIGLDKQFIHDQPTDYAYITQRDLIHLQFRRPRFSHKGTFGHALLMAGSKGSIGAAILSTRACMRAGVGLHTTYLPACGYTAFQSAIPEAMCLVSDNDAFLSGIPNLDRYSAIGFGPGVGNQQQVQGSLKLLIQETKVPLVIDADGLNILAENKTWLSYLPKGTILTPHPGEFRRLVGDFSSDEKRLVGIQDFCEKHQCIMILKGAYSVVGAPDRRLYFNSTGNPGMATAGSGDVLTGIILGYLAQAYDPVTAAILSTFYHGRAGDLASEKLGEASLMAGDIIDYLPEALHN